MRRNRSLRRSAIAGGVAVACVVVVAVSALRSPAPVDHSAEEFQAAAASPGVKHVTDAPSSVALSSFAAWNGDSLLVWGPHRATSASGSSGATYDFGSGEWHAWPAWPYPDPVVDPHAIWTGEEVVVLGTACTDQGMDGALECSPGTLVAAAYAPAGDTWTRLDVPAAANAGRAAGNDGQCCTTVGDVDGAAMFQANGQIFAWASSSGTWSTVPSPPTSSVPSSYCSSDGAATAVDEQTVEVGDGVVHRSRSVTPVTIRDGEEWAVSASFEPDLAAVDAVTAFCGGATNLLALSADWQHGATWSASDGSWVEVPAPTVPLGRTYSGIPADQVRPVDAPASFGFSAWTGVQYVWWNTAFVVQKPAAGIPGPDQVTMEANAVSFDPRSRAWASVAAGPHTLPNGLAWRDGVGFGIAAADDGSPALVAYNPAPNPAPNPTPNPTPNPAPSR